MQETNKTDVLLPNTAVQLIKDLLKYSWEQKLLIKCHDKWFMINLAVLCTCVFDWVEWSTMQSQNSKISVNPITLKANKIVNKIGRNILPIPLESKW